MCVQRNGSKPMVLNEEGGKGLIRVCMHEGHCTLLVGEVRGKDLELEAGGSGLARLKIARMRMGVKRNSAMIKKEGTATSDVKCKVERNEAMRQESTRCKRAPAHSGGNVVVKRERKDELGGEHIKNEPEDTMERTESSGSGGASGRGKGARR